MDAIKNHEENTKQSSIHTKFKIKHSKDKYEEIITYNELMDHLNKLEDGAIMWELRHIVSHQRPLDKNHPSYMGSTYNVKVKWENGEITEEPLSIIAADAPVACAIYAKKMNLLEQPGWKRFKRIAKQQGRIFQEANKAKLRYHQYKPKFKYGVQIPRDYNEAI